MSESPTPNTFILTCPGCKKRFKVVGASLIGKKATCKTCGAGFIVDGGVMSSLPSKNEGEKASPPTANLQSSSSEPPQPSHNENTTLKNEVQKNFRSTFNEIKTFAGDVWRFLRSNDNQAVIGMVYTPWMLVIAILWLVTRYEQVPGIVTVVLMVGIFAMLGSGLCLPGIKPMTSKISAGITVFTALCLLGNALSPLNNSSYFAYTFFSQFLICCFVPWCFVPKFRSVPLLVGIAVFACLTIYTARNAEYSHDWTSKAGWKWTEKRWRWNDVAFHKSAYEDVNFTRMEGGVSESGAMHGKWTYSTLRPVPDSSVEYYWYGEKITEGEWHLRNK